MRVKFASKFYDKHWCDKHCRASLGILFTSFLQRSLRISPQYFLPISLNPNSFPFLRVSSNFLVYCSCQTTFFLMSFFFVSYFSFNLFLPCRGTYVILSHHFGHSLLKLLAFFFFQIALNNKHYLILNFLCIQRSAPRTASFSTLRNLSGFRNYLSKPP